MKIGITGHQHLPNSEAWGWVQESVFRELLSVREPIVGYSCLAIGADQLFAKCILELGGDLRVILPFDGYEEILQTDEERRHLRELVAAARSVEKLRHCATREESYLNAGKRVVELSELVIAVWDGECAEGLGGTGDIVAYAQTKGKRIYHVNPIGGTTEYL